MIGPNSLAAINGVGIKNTQFKPSANVLQRKIVIIGTFDPAKVLVVPELPILVLSPGDVAAQFGNGSMLHRLAIKAFATSRNLETWVIPQAEIGGGVVSDGLISLTGPATAAGILNLYISGELVSSIPVAIGDTATAIAAALVAADLDTSSAITLAVNGVDDFKVDVTSKMKGTYGNDIDISLNLDLDEVLPAGVAAVITPMANGITDPDIDDALNAMGTGDNQNEKFFTSVIHGYGNVTATLDKVAAYNGDGNDFVGNYKKEVARPFRSLVGDVDIDLAALTALIAISDLRKDDRTNGILAVPGSQNHPSELAALAMGLMELTNSVRAEQSYIDAILPGVRLGDDAERWTNEYDNRDLAVKSGISPTFVKNGSLTLQNVVSFYRPDAVPVDSNGYRSMRNISIIQNLLSNQKARFESEKWNGISIVADVQKVTNVQSREKARDTGAVLDELVGLALDYEGLAWLFSASFTIDKLKEGGAVVIRPAGNGFDINFPIVLSGEGGILNQVIEFDTSLAVFL